MASSRTSHKGLLRKQNLSQAGKQPNQIINRREFLDSNIQFHSYSLPEDRQLKVYSRGVPSSFSEQFIKDELTNQRCLVTHIRKFLKERQKLPMFMMTLPNNQENKRIFQIQSLFYITVRMEV